VTVGGASGINDKGQIVANGGYHAYLLTPVAVKQGSIDQCLPCERVAGSVGLNRCALS
jgi:hypothetical protein